MTTAIIRRDTKTAEELVKALSPDSDLWNGRVRDWIFRGVDDSRHVGARGRISGAFIVTRSVRGKPRGFRALRPPQRRRLVETLELAECFQAMLESGEVKRRSEIAARFGITRARG